MSRIVKPRLSFVLRAAFCISLLALTGHGRTPEPWMLASRSTVRIEASNCPGLKTGSGFVWNNSARIVTTFHVVAGCRVVDVRYANGQLLRGRVIRRLIQHDLALLEVSGAPSMPILAHSTATPSSTAPLYAWGYPVKIKGIHESAVRRRQTGTSLRNLLHNDLQRQIVQVGMPNLDSPIYQLGGERVFPGQSGGPVVNATGQVVAIVDGGLEQGAAEINWAIPATQLSALLTSTEPTTGHAGTGLLFAGEVVEADTFPEFVVLDNSAPQSLEARFADVIVRCGGIELAKVRTRSFAELTQFTDDPVGLQQIASFMGAFLQPNDEFDVYQHLESGATAVVPAGTTLTSGQGFCRGSAAGGRVRLFLQLRPVHGGPVAVQQVSSQFEAELSQALGMNGTWIPDPGWTMIAPLQRPDGLVARRKGFTEVTGSPWAPVTSRYVFESLATRGDVFLGVAAMRTDLSPAKIQQQQFCAMNPTEAGCQALFDEMRMVARAIVGVHSSTFPIQ